MYKELVKKLHNRKDMVERVGNWDIEYVLKRLELANKLEMEKLGIVCSQDSGKEV
jgi:predicted nuclease of restriction endonuclease-like RecB superfamily